MFTNNFVVFQISDPASGTHYECKNPYNHTIIRVFYAK